MRKPRLTIRLEHEPVAVCSRCGGSGGEWEQEGPHTVYMPCYHCREAGRCSCAECVEPEKRGA